VEKKRTPHARDAIDKPSPLCCTETGEGGDEASAPAAFLREWIRREQDDYSDGKVRKIDGSDVSIREEL